MSGVWGAGAEWGGKARGPSKRQIMLGFAGQANDSEFRSEGNVKYYKILSKGLT